MEDLRTWLAEIDSIGQLKRVSGASPELEIGIINEINGQRRGPALLFDDIPGYRKGFRMLTSSITNAKRLSVTLGLRDVANDQELVARLEGKMHEFERNAG